MTGYRLPFPMLSEILPGLPQSSALEGPQRPQSGQFSSRSIVWIPNWSSIPYGRAMANQSFHVLDANLLPCPVWVPGELFIGGIGLAKGYWRDAAQTEASFFDHPLTRRAALSHRRYWPLAAGRKYRVPWPEGHPGQAAGLPCGARRDRSDTFPPSVSFGCGRGGKRTSRWREAAGCAM